ncbi:hypothetical protein TraAM80_08722 [Trypanosoma rangeli]|uniref:Uncharacterized protein n=1 Tax=Trypanosoma rangeli TaxID=5698 RepID=A0A3R7K0S5_TRYRA|nr:uncharacterized protein TraAM80_08722 [Trypanosoma rangeli]RNE98589.1 hypothetical protein TraAM80_08722 [Trypanosoma rangeli]|eukprot:RNE98589.1 hypothetical protein TraAM80_08722 [Trypanosoma rangeli]
MPTSFAGGFVVRLSEFDACSIDAARHPPPYILRGRLPDSNFVCDPSPVPATPSWSCRHTFVLAATDPQIVLECYSNNGDAFVGMCAVQTPQLLEAAASFDTVVTLQLRDGHFAMGEISFHAVVEALHVVHMNVVRLAVVPPSLPGATVYVELSCVDEGATAASAVAVSVTSARVATDVAAWASLSPLPPCRLTLGALAREGVAGTFAGDAEEPLGNFRILVPPPVVKTITAAATSESLAGDGTGIYSFDFDVPVESTLEGAPLRSVGSMTLSLGVSLAVRPPPVPINAESPPDTHAHVSGPPVEDLRVLAEVLEQQQRMLGTVRDQLCWVREYKATIRQRLETLRQQPAAPDPQDIGIRSRIERELQDRVLRQEKLQDDLATLQRLRRAAAEEHALRVAEHARSQEELEEEQAKVEFRREGIRRLQLEMQAHAQMEEQREWQRQRQSEEQQQLNSSDAAVLAEVMHLLER